MIQDLRTILSGWDYEPGKISVRKIIGQDGREKIQTRVDLGLIQLEPLGRPDGERPHGCGSLVEFYDRRQAELARNPGGAPPLKLNANECRELRREAYIYYQRYLSNFVLEDFEGVERDTTHNLRVMDLCLTCAESEEDRSALEAQRAYVIMMNTRGRAYRMMRERQFADAMTEVEHGLDEIRALPEEGDEPAVRPEIAVLSALQDELLKEMPDDAEPRIQRDLDEALAREDYEAAARLRDRLGRRKAAS